MHEPNGYDEVDEEQSTAQNEKFKANSYSSDNFALNNASLTEDPPFESNSDSSTTSQSRTAEIVIIFITVFVDFLAFGILFPVIPFLAMKYGANGFIIGLISSAYNIFSFFGSALLGRLSDKIGRKPVLLVSLLGTTLGAILLGLSNSITWIFIARSIAGFCGGSVSVANAYVADITTEQERPKYFGLLGAAVGLGLVCGPALGGLLSRFGFSWVAFSASFIAGPNFLFALFILKESPKKFAQGNKLSVKLLKSVFVTRNIGSLMLVELFLAYSFVCMESMFPLFLNKRYGVGSNIVGYILTLYGVCTALTQGVAIGYLRKFFTDQVLLIVGLLLFGTTLAANGIVYSLTWATVLAVFNSIADGLYTPTLSGLVSASAPADMQGLVLGVAESVASFGRMISPFTSGVLFDVDMNVPFYVAGSVAVVGAVAAGFVQTRKNSFEEVEYAELQTVSEVERELEL